MFLVLKYRDLRSTRERRMKNYGQNLCIEGDPCNCILNFPGVAHWILSHASLVPLVTL